MTSRHSHALAVWRLMFKLSDQLDDMRAEIGQIIAENDLWDENKWDFEGAAMVLQGAARYLKTAADNLMREIEADLENGGS